MLEVASGVEDKKVGGRRLLFGGRVPPNSGIELKKTIIEIMSVVFM